MDFFAKNTFHMFSYIALGMIIFKLFFIDQQTIKNFLIDIFVLGFLVLTWRTSSDFMLFSMGIFILGARGVNFDRIIYLYFYVGIIILTLAVFSSLTGVIQNLVYQTLFNPS